LPRVSATAPNARGLSPLVSASGALVNGVLTAPTDAQLAASAALQAADLPAFQGVKLSTQRSRYEFNATQQIDPRWSFSLGYRHEDKQGLKPMGTVSRLTGGDISTIIPDLVDHSTEQFNAGLQYHRDNLTLQAAYHGSLFTNHVPSMTWTNWAQPASTQTMSSAPSNQFHQLSLTGSVALSPTTRLVATGSYARGTQNQPYLTSVETPLVPVNSLDGLVVTKAVNLKLTSRPLKDLALQAAYKLDDRDNRTAVHTYGYYDAGEEAEGSSLFSAYFPGATLGANTNLNANTPYSKKLQQLNLEAD